MQPGNSSEPCIFVNKKNNEDILIVQSQGERKTLTLQNLASYEEQLKSPGTSAGNRKVQPTRTPSGNIIQVSVQSIKKFFSPLKNTEFERRKASFDYLDLNGVQQQHDYTLGANHGEQLREQSSVDIQATPPSNQLDQSNKQESDKIMDQEDLSTEVASHLSPTQETVKETSRDLKKRKHITSPASPPHSDEQSDKKHQKSKEMTPSSQKRHKMESSENSILDELESLETIDTRTVLKMYHKFKQELSDLRGQVETPRQEVQDKIKTQIEKDLNVTLQEYERKVDSLQTKLTCAVRRCKLTEDILQYKSAVIEDLAKRIDSLEMSNSRRMAILTGLQLSSKKSVCIKQLEDLFYEELEVYTRIEDAYTIGEKAPKPTVITFQTMDDKNNIFQQKHLLKEVRSTDGAKVFLNHYLPAQENEKRKRERKIHKINNASVGDSKQELSYAKGGLKIGTETYRKKVTPPDPTDLLEYTVPQLDEILKKPSTKGPPIKKSDNRLVAYGLDTNNIEEVRETYFKIRLLHAKARHIICAYNLQSLPADQFQLIDSYDDGEAGAGAYLLENMVNSKIEAKAIYVVRYPGKQKLEGGRLQAYLEAAKAMLALKPRNNVTKEDQRFLDYSQKPANLPKDDNKEDRRRACKIKDESHYTNTAIRGTRGKGRGGYHVSNETRKKYQQNRDDVD